MLRIIKKEINISKELYSRLEWICRFKGIDKPKITNGCLRMIEHTNLVYCTCRDRKKKNRTSWCVE